jgi:hypothetical protein
MLDRLAKLGAREKAGLVLAVFMVLGLLCDRLVVRSVVGRVGELARQIGISRGEAEYNRRVLERREAVTREYEAALSLVERVDSPAEAIDRMKDQIDKLAEAAGVKLSSWEERAPRAREAGGWAEHSVAVRQFDAPMDNLLVFLHRLHSGPGLLRVDELKLAPDKAGGRMTGSMVITKVVMTPADQGQPAGGKG